MKIFNFFTNLRRNNIQSPFNNNSTFVDIIPEIEERLNEVHAKAKEVVARARYDASQELPPPEIKQSFLSDTELTIFSTFRDFFRQSSRKLNITIAELKEQLVSISRKQDMFGNDPAEVIDKIKREELERYTLKIEAIDEEARMQLDSLCRNKKNALDKQSEAFADQRTIKDSIKERPRQTPFQKMMPYYICAGLVGIGDIATIYNNLQSSAKIAPLFSLLLALVIAVVVMVSAHFTGYYFKTEGTSSKGFQGSLMVGIAIIIGLGLLGIRYNAGFMIIFNIAFFLALVMFSFFLTHKEDQLISKYFNAERVVIDSERDIKKIDKEIKEVQKAKGRQKLEATQDYKQAMSRRIANYKEATIDKYNKLNEALKAVMEFQKNLFLRSESICHKSIFDYRNINQDERSQRGLPLVASWLESNKLPPLLPKDDPDYPLTENNSFSSLEPPGKSPFQGNHYLLNLLLLMKVFLFSSCNIFQSDTSKTTECLIVFDQTDRHIVDPTNSSKFVSDLIDIDSITVFHSSVSLRITCFNDQFINPEITVTLPPPGNIASEITAHRLSRQSQFISEASQAFQEVFVFSEEKEKSMIFCPLCYQFERLQSSRAEKKIVILFTDLLENTDHFSFYKYQQHPEKIFDQKDNISAILEGNCPLPDLNGIEIFIIHQPTKTTDKLFDATRRFVKDYFEYKGAQVNLYTSIN